MPGRFANLEFDDGQLHEAGREAAAHTQRHTPEDAAQLALTRASEEYRWGHFEPALRYYTRALQERRTLIPAWVGQTQMLVQLDECHEARVWCDKALELFRNNGELLAAKSQACVRLKDYKAALASSDAALAAPGTSAWRWIARGEVLLAKRQRFAAECFQKALAEPAVDWFEHVVIARIYLYYDRITNALHHMKSAVELEPTHGYVWFTLAQCQQALGLCVAAAESYEHCLMLRPDYEEAARGLNALPGGSRFWKRLARMLFVWRRR